MSQSVKLSNGNYIDVEGVWDATQGKSQSEINEQISKLCVKRLPARGATVYWTIVVSTHEPLLLLVDSNGYSNIYAVNANSKVSTLLETESGYTPTISKVSGANGFTINLTLKPWSSALIITASNVTITTSSQ